MISPHLTVEEAYLLCKLVRGIDAEAVLALGPVPTVGEDERFPGGFTIRAEKCPNRRGVEAVIAHFARRVTTFDDLLPQLDQRRRAGRVGGGRIQTGLDRPADGRAGSSGSSCWWCKTCSPRRCPNVRPTCCPARPTPSATVRTSTMPTGCNRLPGRSARRWECEPTGSLLWELLGGKGLYNSRDGVGRNRPRNPLFLRRRPPGVGNRRQFARKPDSRAVDPACRAGLCT